MIDGTELTRVFERQAPDGSVYLIGMLGDAGIIIVKDQTRPGAWRVMLSDPTQLSSRDHGSAARAIAAPPAVDSDGWYRSDNIDDDLPDDLMASPSRQDGR